MNLVVDTSVLIAVLIDEPERQRLIVRTKGVDLIAPASVHWEIGNALAAMLKRNRITLEQVKIVLEAYHQIPIRFLEVDLATAMGLAAHHNLYSYDAYIFGVCAGESVQLDFSRQRSSLCSQKCGVGHSGGAPMKEYTYSEARQSFSSVLDKAKREGAVRIRRRDGQVFILRPEGSTKSPLDVPGINLNLGRDEIVEFIHAGRRKTD